MSLSVGAVVALTAFVGFESSATLGVEARKPYAAIPLVAYLGAEALSSRAAGGWMFGVVMLVGVTAYRLWVRRRPWLRETIGAWDESSAGDVLGGAVSDVRRD